jgi:hypothetical protein
MSRRLTSLLSLTFAVLVAACGTSTPTAAPPTAAPTPLPTPTPELTAAPTATPVPATAAPADPYAGQAYRLTLPEGWQAFDMKDAAGQAALDAFVQANPDMSASIDAFKALPNVVMAVNQVLGNVVVSVSIPTTGLSLDVIAASFTAQFAAVPGIQDTPEATSTSVTAGPAVHWHLTIVANKPSGGTYTVGESIYLVTNDTTAVLVEFVEVNGAPVPQEDQVIQSLRFN